MLHSEKQTSKNPETNPKNPSAPAVAGKPVFRADHVGSFLRPPELLAARKQFKNGGISAHELRATEDKHIADIVAMQERVGLDSITDGEFRRHLFHVDYLTRIDGVKEIPSRVEITFQREDENLKFAPPTLAVTDKLNLRKAVQLEDFEFLKSVTDRTPKVTIPSPSMLHFRGGRGAISQEAYPEMEGFYADLVKVYRKEVADLAAAGCRSIQMDDTNLAYLCDSTHRERARAIGEDPEKLPALYARLISECFAERPSDMAASIHLCRGNFRGAWAAEGGYEPVADVMFNQTAIDSFFLEFDDARSGGFEPLRFLPKGKVVVLGLVSSKKGKLENRDDIIRRIEEASKFADISQLALSPQCGFSSEEEGNDLTPGEQEAKLDLVVDVARAVWGTAS